MTLHTIESLVSLVKEQTTNAVYDVICSAESLYPDFADCTSLGEWKNLEAAQDLMQRVFNQLIVNNEPIKQAVDVVADSINANLIDDAKENIKVLYHYSNSMFVKFDTSKCVGIWLTTITPEQSDLIDEIGAAGSKYVAVCYANIDGERLLNAGGYDVAEKLAESNCHYIENRFDGFADYGFSDHNLVSIKEWIEL